MKKRVSLNRWIRTACLAVALVGVYLGIAIVHPSVSKAFTLIEKPAVVFPEITAASHENVSLCTNNLVGDGTVSIVVGLVDIADSTKFLQGTTPVTASLDPKKGGCFLLLPAVQLTAGILPPPARTGIPVMFVTGPDETAAGGGGAGKGLVSSLQLVGADGTIKLITSPILLPNVGLPAVQ